MPSSYAVVSSSLGVRKPAENPLGITGVDHTSIPKGHGVVGILPGLRDSMRGHDDGQSPNLGQTPNRLHQGARRLGIQGGRGFVKQENLRGGHQRSCEVHPLLLAHGQLIPGPFEQGRLELGEKHDLARQSIKLIGLNAREFSRHRQVIRDGSRKHHGCLKDECHPVSKLRDRVLGDRTTVEENVSLGRIIEPVEEPEKRRLPAAGGPAQDCNQMPRNRDVDVLKDRTSGPLLADAAKLKGGDIYGRLQMSVPSRLVAPSPNVR